MQALHTAIALAAAASAASASTNRTLAFRVVRDAVHQGDCQGDASDVVP